MRRREALTSANAIKIRPLGATSPRIGGHGKEFAVDDHQTDLSMRGRVSRSAEADQAGALTPSAP